MEMTQKAIAKAVSTHGAQVLSQKDLFCKFLSDMVPEHVEMVELIKMVYTDDLGHILSEASQASYSDKEKYYSEIDSYLLNKSGLIEPIRSKFINLFRNAFRRKTVEVKKFKDYKPALRMIKQEFGPYVPDDVIQAFLEENRLFYRFSLTVDDVKRDIKNA